jgi:hypothetical protein
MGVSVGCGNRSNAGIVSSTLFVMIISGNAQNGWEYMLDHYEYREIQRTLCFHVICLHTFHAIFEQRNSKLSIHVVFPCNMSSYLSCYI